MNPYSLNMNSRYYRDERSAILVQSLEQKEGELGMGNRDGILRWDVGIGNVMCTGWFSGLVSGLCSCVHVQGIECGRFFHNKDRIGWNRSSWRGKEFVDRREAYEQDKALWRG